MRRTRLFMTAISTAICLAMQFAVANAAITVTGSYSPALPWDSTSNVRIGDADYGSGSLTIVNDSLNVRNCYLGDNISSSGTAEVSGNSSVFSMSGGTAHSLYVGYRGEGTMKIYDGATVSIPVGTAQVTYFPGSSGTIDFGAAGGTLNAKSLIATSSQLQGTGGTINVNGWVGDSLTFDASGSHGLVQHLSLNGGAVALNLDMSVPANAGYLGISNGMLSIKDGVTVNSERAYTGYAEGMTGNVTVDGSTWNNSLYFYAGFSGNGTMDIKNGGSVTTANCYLTYNTGSAYTINVNNSTLSTNGLYVGQSGNGTLNISNGGSVISSSSSTIASGSASVGAVTVDGTDSTWDVTNISVSATLTVASSGQGSLDIKNGGAVTSDKGYIGSSSSGIGSVTVDGANSSWTINSTSADTFRVGYSGAGSLSITNGGSVTCSYGTVNYNGSTKSSTATVNGANSTWTNSTKLIIAKKGEGTVNVENGGTLIANAIEGNAGVMALNIDGGVVKPYDASNANWIVKGTNAGSSVFVKEGGATFDSAGFDVGVTAPIAHGGTDATDGGLTKTGNGTLTLSGANDYTGRTVVQQGVLTLKANAQNAVLNLGGTDVQAGTLVFDYAGGSDPVAAIRSNLRDSFIAGGGQLTSGMMFTSTGSALGYGLGYDDDTVAETVSVEIALFGDLNFDGTVNGSDLTLMGQNWLGSDKLWTQGDVNYDGIVNGSDLTLMGQNWLDTVAGTSFKTAVAMAGFTQAVPEPGTLALLALAASSMAAAAWFRRQRG